MNEVKVSPFPLFSPWKVGIGATWQTPPVAPGATGRLHQLHPVPDLQKVASTQAVLGDTKTPQVPAGDTFWLAWINFLGLVTHIIIRDEKIKGICTCFHHIYTIMCLVHQIRLLCMVFVFWYQIMSRITLFFGQIFVANHAVLVTHFDP